MEIIQKAKNGQPVYLIKKYEELTLPELKILRFPDTDKTEDYRHYAVHYNKGGELKRVKPNDYTEQKSREIRKKLQSVKYIR